ncbi:MAG: type I methionyl aminopeptidase [Patulibacter sp.]|nr:type I methionyl aminopeptidase [Patulibacter sp.]
MAIALKRPDEIAGIDAAGRLAADVLDELVRRCAVGVCGLDLDAIARELIVERGGTPTFLGYRGYPQSICVSVNDVIVHGIPTSVAFDDGDLVSVDVGVTLDGWVADTARTTIVGAESGRDAELISVAERALDAGLAACVVGGSVGDIGAAIEAEVSGSGATVFPTLIGHGVGFRLHEDPQVPNVGTVGAGARLEAGTVMAVEPMISWGAPHVRLASDGWSVFALDGAQAAHAEVTVAVTDEGPQVLTPWGDRWPARRPHVGDPAR